MSERSPVCTTVAIEPPTCDRNTPCRVWARAGDRIRIWTRVQVWVGIVDSLSTLADRLRSDLGRAARTCSSGLDALGRRLGYHAEVGLRAGVARVFRSGFVEKFRGVRVRSVEPLLAGGGHETVGDVERTVKQLRFTATSENVARKVRSILV